MIADPFVMSDGLVGMDFHLAEAEDEDAPDGDTVFTSPIDGGTTLRARKAAAPIGAVIAGTCSAADLRVAA